MQASVEDIIISGRARVIMKPLLDRLPLVGALQVPDLAFLNTPTKALTHHLLEGWVSTLVHACLIWLFRHGFDSTGVLVHKKAKCR